MEKLLLIDGNSLINRAFYALPPLNNKKGEPTQAVYGFTTMLIKMLETYSPEYIAVAFDLPAPTFRHKMYDGYKATRKKMPEELAVQLPILKEQLRLMNIAIVEKEGYEADDIIGTLSKTPGVETYIVTGDRDSFQLISDTTKVVLTKRGITETLVLDEEVLMKEYSLTPSGVIEFKALAGDTSDNIPGVSGVGEKTAISLIEKYKTVGDVYAHLDEIKGKLAEKLLVSKDNAFLSKELATINCEVPLEVTLDDFKYDFPFSAQVRTFFADNAFKSLVKRDELFVVDEHSEKKAVEIEEIKIKTTDDLIKIFQDKKQFSLVMADDIHISFDGLKEYVLCVSRSLIDDGMFYGVLMSAIKPIVENSHLIVFDGKKVMRQLNEQGVTLKSYDDVRLMQHLVDMRVDNNTVSELLQSEYGDANYPASKIYALYGDLLSQIESMSIYSFYKEVELPLERVLYNMEKRGVEVDQSVFDALSVQFNSQISKLEQEIHALAGEKFNINSPKQLAEVLFNKLMIPYPKKSNKHSTNAEILDMLMNKHEIIPLITKYRFASKLNSTYIEGMRKLVASDGAIHTEYNQMLTTTGRLSSSEPNLQNIPVREEEGRLLRGLFVARKGYTLVSADYSQIELRLLAHFSGDKIMLEQYRTGADIHSRTAAEIFGVDISKVTDQMRRTAKTVNFGIIYGISDYGLSQNLHCSVAKAREYMNIYFERFPSIKPYFDGIVENAKKTGYTTTLMGRLRYIPELASPNFQTRQFGERAAMNMPLQGSAADIIKIAMVKVAKELEGMKSKLILQIHDELIIEASDDELERVKEILKNCMENAVNLAVPLTVDISNGKSWLEC